MITPSVLAATDCDQAPRPAAPSCFRPSLGVAAETRWQAVERAGETLAVLACAPLAERPRALLDLPLRLRSASRGRQLRFTQGLEDLAFVVETGLAALIGAQRAGRDVEAPARVLWQEFRSARSQLETLAGLSHAGPDPTPRS